MASNYKELKLVIGEFSERYPRPDLDLVLQPLSPIKTEEMWQNADKCGVYFLFDKNEVLMYIGKASFNSNIGVRVGERFSSKDCRCLVDKFCSVTMLATIAFQNERAFEAPSIEEYLIRRLQPPLNEVGTSEGN